MTAFIYQVHEEAAKKERKGHKKRFLSGLYRLGLRRFLACVSGHIHE